MCWQIMMPKMRTSHIVVLLLNIARCFGYECASCTECPLCPAAAFRTNDDFMQHEWFAQSTPIDPAHNRCKNTELTKVKLEQIKRPYDLTVSLGSACGPAAHMRRLNLRRFSMPIDWVVSQSLSDVNRLLRNRFDGFMELNNMRIIDGSAVFVDDEIVQPVKSYFVQDICYNIISVHDFPVLPHEDWTVQYGPYKNKLNFRVNRFLDQIINSQSVLFVRWSASYDEVIELQSVLSEMTKGDFCILVINPVDGLQGVVEMDWGIHRVCSVNAPNRSEDNAIWNNILSGITLVDRS